MKILSWNVNGLRAILQKDFEEKIRNLDLDVLCLQEIKAFGNQIEPDILSFLPHKIYNSACRAGYSGTAIFSKKEIFPVSTASIENTIIPNEGRVIAVEFPTFFLVNVYTPNSGAELLRLNFRTQIWDPAFGLFLKKLEKSKPVIACGDFNVAHQEIDLANPNANHFSAGFTDAERAGMSWYLQNGLVDVFRYFFPSESKAYTWWSYRALSRQRNVGWRIDYFLASQIFLEKIKKIAILKEISGSDHAPVLLEITD